jgi:heptosyltransferase-2
MGMDGTDLDTAPPERVLVVGTRYIGDTVLAIPFLRNLRQSFPGAIIHVHAEGAARQVLAACPFIDRFVMRQRIAGGGATAWRALRDLAVEAAAWRRVRYTRAYLLKSAPSAALLAALAAIPHRSGFARGINRALLTRAVPLRAGRHQADLYLDLLRADGLAIDDGRNDNWVLPADAARADVLLGGLPVGRRVVFLAPSASDRRRNWPAERWIETVRWLVSERQCEIVLAGSRPDGALHAAILAGAGPTVATHVHDFSEVTTLGEATALIAQADLCVGVDTGLPHLASSFGVPAVKLFGPTDPSRWGIWRAAGGVVHGADTTAREPMHAIDVAAVCAAVDGVLQGRPAVRTNTGAGQWSMPSPRAELASV